MPTFGWIREDDLDAFYESTGRILDPSQVIEPVFTCPFCALAFSAQPAFNEHVYASHRVERPLIMFRGKEPAVKDIVRSYLAPADIALANTSFAKVHINGTKPKQMNAVELNKLLVRTSQAEIKLELVNSEQQNAAPVTSFYGISFRIADSEVLTSVEKAFTETLVSATITRGSIDTFLSDQRTQGPGKEYASGLANYCLGILLKERPEGQNLTTPLFRYRELYGTALDILKDFQCPLAILIASLIRFSMNDFEGNRRRTGYLKLDLANDLLWDPDYDALPSSSESASHRPVCPVDHGTWRVLEMASRLVAQQRWSPILDDECRGLAQSDLLDESDHQKAYAIWAAVAWRLGARESITEPLTQIAEVYPFSRWAREYLEQVST